MTSPYLSDPLDPHFDIVQLTGAGRPLFLEDEIEVLYQSSLTVQSSDPDKSRGGGGPQLSDARIRLTTHRLILESNNNHQPRALSLSKVNTTDRKKGGIFSKPRFFISVHGAQDIQVRIVFQSGGNTALSQFGETLENQLQRRNWERKRGKSSSATGAGGGGGSGSKKTAATAAEFCVRSAGVGGILRRIESDSRATKQNLDQAFTDLTSLMDNAREMVDLAEKFSSKLKQREQQQNQQGTQESAEDKKEQEQFDNLLLNLGLVLPSGPTVSKHTAGAQYHQELAREIADFLERPLNTQWNGVIALTDAFCLYNRARGTDLISPEDMYKACSLFGQLALKMHLKTFDSGVTVIQSEQFTDQAICQRIEKLLLEVGKDFITVVDVASSFGVSIVLAREQLLIAEQREQLCRDEVSSGINFYRNIFLDY